MKKVRVRFAPSPTGMLHVGSLRTALYNYLYAKNQKGDFILRIEDTDQSRYVEGAVQNLIATLEWCGLDFDEGPDKNGDSGPYFQSQRTRIYNEHINRLLEKTHAYRCFCSQERLENLRQEQMSKNMDPKYDGFCRNINYLESKKRAEKEKFVIRLKVPDEGETVVDDLIRGRVVFNNDTIDDQVLIKSDGYPTYHFANVLDDHLMRISHVIRGEEWLPSTPKHVLLYKYFEWDLPQFAHLPLLLNKDKSKLSKRQGDVAVEDYKKKGFLSQAILNFVALLGWNKGDDQEIFTINELIQYFSLDKVNKAGSVFDIDKLIWLNGIHIRKLSDEDYFEKALNIFDTIKSSNFDEYKLKSIAKSLKERITTFKDLEEKSKIFFEDLISKYDSESLNWIQNDQSKKMFKTVISELDNYQELNLKVFKNLMQEVQKKSGLKGKELWMPLRAALTGTVTGPELPLVIDIFGKQKIVNLLNVAIKK